MAERRKSQRRPPRAPRAGSLGGRPRERLGARTERSLEESDGGQGTLIGRHPVREALRSGRAITRVWVQEGLNEGSLREIVGLARQQHLTVVEVPKPFLDRLANGIPHQGVGAQAALKPTLNLEQLLDLLKASSNPFLYILDGIQDPHNLGAIFRTADATGATAVVVPERGASGLTAVVAKASAGAIEYVPVVRTGNLAQAIDKLKQAGVFVFAADPAASTLYTEVDWSGASAVVIGGEGRGVRPLVRARSDGLVRLPMMGQVASLNASNAACVIGFEVVRQRQAKKSVLTRL